MNIFSVVKLILGIFDVILAAEKTDKKGVEKEKLAYELLDKRLLDPLSAFDVIDSASLFSKIVKKVIKILNKKIGSSWYSFEIVVDLLKLLLSNILLAEISGEKGQVKEYIAALSIFKKLNFKGENMDFLKVATLIISLIKGIVAVLNDTLGEDWGKSLKNSNDVEENLKK